MNTLNLGTEGGRLPTYAELGQDTWWGREFEPPMRRSGPKPQDLKTRIISAGSGT